MTAYDEYRAALERVNAALILATVATDCDERLNMQCLARIYIELAAEIRHGIERLPLR